MRFSRFGYFLILLCVFTFASDLRAACACTTADAPFTGDGVHNSRKAGNTFWDSGNCLGSEKFSSCNDLSGGNDACTLNCGGCAYQLTGPAATEVGCYSDAGCTTTPCVGVSETTSPLEIWKSVKRVWQVFTSRS